jgi:hypothetical protein
MHGHPNIKKDFHICVVTLLAQTIHALSIHTQILLIRIYKDLDDIEKAVFAKDRSRSCLGLLRILVARVQVLLTTSLNNTYYIISYTVQTFGLS